MGLLWSAALRPGGDRSELLAAGELPAPVEVEGEDGIISSYSLYWFCLDKISEINFVFFRFSFFLVFFEFD